MNAPGVLRRGAAAVLALAMFATGALAQTGGAPSVTGVARSAPASASASESAKVLRVCQDPNNLPFSNRALQGFENKIAALLAADLGWQIAYTWYPQRMGFIRNTLRAKEPGSDGYKCDLVTGVASGFDMGATTRPYYRSAYAMAYVKGKGLDSVQTLEDLLKLPPDKLASLRLGVFAGSPVTDWLLDHGLIERMVPYQAQSGDPADYPGQMVEQDLAKGAIDVAFIWGPIAGYFAHEAKAVPIVAIPLTPHPNVQFEFDIAMATRFGETAYKQRIDEAIERNRSRINAILAQYGVPLLTMRQEPRAAAR